MAPKTDLPTAYVDINDIVWATGPDDDPAELDALPERTVIEVETSPTATDKQIIQTAVGAMTLRREILSYDATVKRT